MNVSTLILRSSDPTGLQVWYAIGFCAGIALFFYGFRLLQRRRLILDTPFSKIRSASMGMVEISGLAVGPYTMIAPITARPCYYYRTLVWEWKQDGKNKSWVPVAGECMHVPFFVDDNTGRMLVDPRGADLDLHCDFKEEFNSSFFSNRDNAPGNVNSFLSRHGVVTSNKIKVEEYCIKPKNSLFILGTLGENTGLEVGPQPIQEIEPIYSGSEFTLPVKSLSFSAAAGGGDSVVRSLFDRFATQSEAPQSQVSRLSPAGGLAKPGDKAQQQKVTAALLKAGISNPAAWAAAGVSVAGAATPGVQVIAAPSVASASAVDSGSAAIAGGFEPHPPVVLRKGTNNKTFLISWRSQQEVARSLGWKCTLMIWGGPALALLCLHFLLRIKNLF